MLVGALEYSSLRIDTRSCGPLVYYRYSEGLPSTAVAVVHIVLLESYIADIIYQYKGKLEQTVLGYSVCARGLRDAQLRGHALQSHTIIGQVAVDE